MELRNIYRVFISLHIFFPIIKRMFLIENIKHLKIIKINEEYKFSFLPLHKHFIYLFFLVINDSRMYLDILHRHGLRKLFNVLFFILISKLAASLVCGSSFPASFPPWHLLSLHSFFPSPSS